MIQAALSKPQHISLLLVCPLGATSPFAMMISDRMVMEEAPGSRMSGL